MQTKYPKKRKIKVVKNQSLHSSNEVTEKLNEQQAQIEELQTKATKAEVNQAYVESKTKNWNKAYDKTEILEYELNVTNNHAVNAHLRLDAVDLQLQSIVANGETNTVDLSAITKRVSLSESAINRNAQDIYNLQLAGDQTTQDLQNLNSQIASLQEQINNSSANVDLTEVYDLINQNTQSIDDLNINLGSQIAQNTEDLYVLKADFSTLQANTDVAITDAEILKTKFDSLQSQTTQNKNDIDSLQNQVDINTQKIEALQNADPNATELDLIDLTQRVSTNEQNIASLQAQQNININDIATLMQFKQRFDTTLDPSYQPKSYSDFPAGTIVQTYACYQRELDLNSSSLITTPKAYFLAEQESQGTVNVYFDLKSDVEEQEILVETYLNDTLISTNFIDITQNIQTYNITLYDKPLNTTNKQNTFYFKLKPNPNKKFYLYNLKIDLIAPNADLIPITSPFNVEYIDGKYYVSDCSDGTAKLATIEAQNMYNMQSLTFEDMGVDAQAMYVGAGTKNYNNVYMFDNFATAYIKKDDYLHYTDTINNKSNKNTHYKFIDWLQYKNTNILFLTNSYVDLKPKYSTIYYSSGSMGTGTIKSPVTNVVRTYAVKFFGDINSLVNAYTCTSITGDGQVYVTHSSSDNANHTINLGYGTRARLYYEYLNTINDYALNVFVKKFDKIVKYNLTFNSTSGYTINSITEIGTYEDIFLGAKDDYFAVKNGKLNYHFLPDNTTTN